jgi:hypothetical protein
MVADPHAPPSITNSSLWYTTNSALWGSPTCGRSADSWSALGRVDHYITLLDLLSARYEGDSLSEDMPQSGRAPRSTGRAIIGNP